MVRTAFLHCNHPSRDYGTPFGGSRDSILQDFKTPVGKKILRRSLRKREERIQKRRKAYIFSVPTTSASVVSHGEVLVVE